MKPVMDDVWYSLGVTIDSPMWKMYVRLNGRTNEEVYVCVQQFCFEYISILYVYKKSFVDDWVGSMKDNGFYKEKPGCLIHICELLENMNE
jgi:hypothetical protein